MDVITMLDELERKALHDEQLRRRLLDTKEEAEPISAFCKVCMVNL